MNNHKTQNKLDVIITHFLRKAYIVLEKNKLTLLRYYFLSPIVVLIGAWPCSPYFPGVIFHFLIAVSAGFLFIVTNYFFLTKKEDSFGEIQLNKFKIFTKNKIKYSFILISLITILNGPRHDYKSYVRQWLLIFNGNDPWIGTDNAYGPIHNLFSLFAVINPILPKFIFVVVFFYSFYKLNFTNYKLIKGKDNISNKILSLIVSMCPVLIIVAPLNANNDTLVCGLVIYALFIHLSLDGSKKAQLITGILFGFASMIKVYPLIVSIPFLIRNFKIKFTFLLSLSSTLFAIIFLSYTVWGNSIFQPIFFASGRESTHFSIFYFLRSTFNLNIDSFNTLLMILVMVIIFFIIQYKNIDLIPSTIIIFLPVLSIYKVAHIQFFLFFFATLPLLARYLKQYDLNELKPLCISYLVLLGFLNFYISLSHLTCGMYVGPASKFRDHFGAMIYLPIILNLIIQFIKTTSKKPKLFSTKQI